jgi:hypothetical protein
MHVVNDVQHHHGDNDDDAGFFTAKFGFDDEGEASTGAGKLSAYVNSVHTAEKPANVIHGHLTKLIEYQSDANLIHLVSSTSDTTTCDTTSTTCAAPRW